MPGVEPQGVNSTVAGVPGAPVKLRAESHLYSRLHILKTVSAMHAAAPTAQSASASQACLEGRTALETASI